MSSRFENLLHDGLVLNQIEKKKSSAYALFSMAAEMEKQNYLPYLFGASCSDNAVGSLEEAVNKNPNSLNSLILLGEAYASKGDVVKSIQCFESAAQIFPEYEIPYVRAEALLKILGREKESMGLGKKAEDLRSILKQ